jgi:hypothetical protein
MNEIKNPESNLWSWLGKLSVVVTMIYASTEIYKNISKTPEHSAECVGHYHKYETAADFTFAANQNSEYKSALKSEIEDKGLTKEGDIDSLVSKIKADTTNSLRKSTFKSNVLELNNYGSEYHSYKIFWEFFIANKGNKPLEDLILELPIEGYYKIVLPNNDVKTGSFKNRISLYDLKPSYSTSIMIWSELNYYKFEDYGFPSVEKEGKFTHKNGWFQIEYPNKPNL